MTLRILTLAIVLLALAATVASAKCPAGHDLVAFVRAQHPTVAVYAKASPSIMNAAHELASTIGEMAGAPVAVVTYTSITPLKPDMHVAWIVEDLWVFSFVGFWPGDSIDRYEADSHNHDTFRISNDKSTTTFTGVTDRAAAYAVYDYEERVLGVRWYAPGVTYIPHPAKLVLPTGDVASRAAFAYRDTDIFAAQGDAAWDAHLHLSGNSTPDMSAYGGRYQFFNGAENFYGLVPPATYFATHPEYFSEIAGKRNSDPRSQLCLSNDDVFHIVVDGLVAEANANPAMQVLGLSPNDARGGWCTCDKCAASDAKFGGPSGTELDFVNRVAAAVQTRLGKRKIWVETLAYLYTETPPKDDAVKPASNVIILWAPLHADVGHGLIDKMNVVHKGTLDAWAHLVDLSAPNEKYGWNPAGQQRFQVWHYAANFSYYLQPLPDWDELAVDMAYYKLQRVDGVFIEGDYQSPGEMGLLRTYVIGHLLWNPNQAVWPLIADFCHGYYGPAGDRVLAYLTLMQAAVTSGATHVGIYDDPDKAAYLTPDIVAKAEAALNPPEAAALPPVYQARVDEVGLGLREIDLARTQPAPSASPADRAAYRSRFDTFVADLHRFHITAIGEQYSTDAYIADMDKAIGGP